MSRRRFIALVAVALVVGGVIYAWVNVPRDSTTRATVGEAVEEFRRSVERQGKGLPGGAGLGVYRYEIHGGESVDATILGARHNYGGVSTIAITPTPCGVEERWQILARRWTELQFCPTETGSRLVTLRDSHEFFGEGEVVTYDCGGDEIPNAFDLREGMSWTIVCTTDDASIRNETRMIGIEKVEVAGKPLDAVHTRSILTLEGKISGSDERDEWRRRADGLLLRRTVDTDASLEVLGGASYKESYSLELLSTEPQR